MTIVGPLTSLALGIAFLFLGQRAAGEALPTSAQGLAQIGPLATLLLWLGPINILLAIFNMIPGFPLDGGRVLRSILWAFSGNLRRATRWATLVGHAVAWLFIIAGLAMIFGFQIPFLGGGFIGGLWLAFIGWFLNNAAAQSYQQVVIDDVLDGVAVARLMRSDAPTVIPEMRISQLVDEYVVGTDERAFPVLEGEHLVGMACLEDIRKVPRSEWDQTQVQDIMTPADQLEFVAPREDASDALRKLSRRDVRQMPVVQEGRLVGVLRRRDILRWLNINSDLTTS